MWKGFALGFSLLLGASPALAQRPQQQQDPFAGQFWATEVALSPPDAADSADKLAAEFAALAPQRKGVQDTYVLVASLYGQPVFENEAKEAAAILSRHFDAQGRTLILSAGRGDGTKRAYPAATPDNIEAAIGKIGRTIDPNEDLVVIFFTTHGAQDGSLALIEENRMQGFMRPLNLRASLQAAGIKSKVLIVSACFSGNFIPPFNDDDTIVLTAAAADRTSFGCEPSRDYTYFGDAMFNHALRSGQSLLSAYDEALGLISKWEGDLHKQWEQMPPSQRASSPEPIPSNPQKNVGDGVLAMVQKAEAYDEAISCAGHLAFALDRARSSRGLKGLSDPTALQTARSQAEAKANALAGPAGRTPQDVAKAIAAMSATVNTTYPQMTETVAAHAAACAASPTGGKAHTD